LTQVRGEMGGQIVIEALARREQRHPAGRLVTR